MNDKSNSNPCVNELLKEMNLLKKENRKLKDQLYESNETMNAVQKALKLGPYNDWADRAIKRYQEKYSEIGG